MSYDHILPFGRPVESSLNSSDQIRASGSDPLQALVPRMIVAKAKMNVQSVRPCILDSKF